VGDDPARRQIEIAGVLMQFIAQQREQAGFAGTVGADQTDLPAGINGQGNLVKKRLAAALQRSKSGLPPRCSESWRRVSIMGEVYQFNAAAEVARNRRRWPTIGKTCQIHFIP